RRLEVRHPGRGLARVVMDQRPRRGTLEAAELPEVLAGLPIARVLAAAELASALAGDAERTGEGLLGRRGAAVCARGAFLERVASAGVIERQRPGHAVLLADGRRRAITSGRVVGYVCSHEHAP